jgi:hypothetical protein
LARTAWSSVACFLAIQHLALFLVALVLFLALVALVAAAADPLSRLRRATTDRPGAPRAAQCTIVTADVGSGRGTRRVPWAARKTQPTGIGTRAGEEETGDKGYLPSSLLFRCQYCLALPHGSGYAPRRLAVHVLQQPGRADPA